MDIKRGSHKKPICDQESVPEEQIRLLSLESDKPGDVCGKDIMPHGQSEFASARDDDYDSDESLCNLSKLARGKPKSNTRQPEKQYENWTPSIKKSTNLTEEVLEIYKNLRKGYIVSRSKILLYCPWSMVLKYPHQFLDPSNRSKIEREFAKSAIFTTPRWHL